MQKPLKRDFYITLFLARLFFEEKKSSFCDSLGVGGGVVGVQKL